MDYEGNFFPDKDDEELSVRKRRFKTARRWIFYGIIIIVYLISFTVLFTNCEPDMYEEYVFSENARDIYKESPDSFQVYEIFPQSWMTYDGGVQVKGVAYTPNTNEMELGIKFNKKYIDEKGNEPIFELHYIYGEQNKVLKITNTIDDKKGRYHYKRISYVVDPIPLEENPYTNPDLISHDSEEEESIDTEGMVETFKYVLVIRYPENTAPDYQDEELDYQSKNITVYNNNTAIQLVKYK